MALSRLVPLQHTDWADDNPYYLVLADDERGIQIDLGERGWAKTNAEWMRKPGVWFLMLKTTQSPVLTLLVNPGEQPYYTARHVGIAGSGGSAEVVAYGIGKKRHDGQMDRLWILPNGVVCGGDDVDDLSIRILKGRR